MTTFPIGPLSRNEFGQLFEIANTLASEFCYFQSSAVDRVYRLSGGLPFYGHLFGQLALAQYSEVHAQGLWGLGRRARPGPIPISADEIEATRAALRNQLRQYELIAGQLCSTLGLSGAQLEGLAATGFHEADDETLERLTTASALVRQSIRREENKLTLVDQVLQQYIRITR
jgi:hypothetical protein